MAAALHTWLERNVQPAARQLLGEEIAAVSGALGYQCRAPTSGARLARFCQRHRYSRVRHAQRTQAKRSRGLGTDGKSTPERRTYNLGAKGAETMRRWQIVAGREPDSSVAGRTRQDREPFERPCRPEDPAKCAEPGPEQRFLKRIHQEACGLFDTVLGPDANKDHRHFHLDLAERSRRSSYCR